MESQILTGPETTLLSLFNEGNKTFESLKEKVPFSEKELMGILESLINKSILVFDKNKKSYEYDSPVKGDKIILEGNVMLPMTIIRKEDCILVSRGKWYKFPTDFDVRTIIWNVKLPNKTSSTLVDLIKDSVLKNRKARVQTMPEHKNLVNKIVPYSNRISLLLNAIGEEATDVTIIFKIILDDFVQFKGFSIRSLINTKELITELEKDNDVRDFSNINLNRIFNFSDFIFANNCIPYEFISETKEIKFVKITQIKKSLEISYNIMTKNGVVEKFDSDNFDNISEGVAKIKSLFDGYGSHLLNELDFIVELSE